jgi:magnesium transporter
MGSSSGKYNLNDPILSYVRKDFTAFPETFSVREALDAIRSKGMGEKVIYFYVSGEDGVLRGVIPTRRLLMAQPDSLVSSIMIANVVSIPAEATLYDACEFFMMHRFLAFPVVDQQGRMEGVIDVSLFADEILDLSEKRRHDEIFDVIGFRLSQELGQGALNSFRLRFPWLFATIISGFACAALVSLYEATLERSLVLAFFLTLALGLGESVGVQTMTASIHSLRLGRFNWSWFRTEFRKQVLAGLLLGLACATVVGLAVWLWRQQPLPALSIALSILGAQICSCVCGLSIPTLFHWAKKDPKIASGPITLALSDVITIFIYFQVAKTLLR